MTEKLRILDAGCGLGSGTRLSFPEADLVRLDIDPEVEADYHLDIRDPLPFGEEFDIVVASHVLEHVERAKMVIALKNLRNVLKEGGELYLITPSLEWAAGELLRIKPSNVVLGVIFGAQANQFDYHKCGFTLAWLRDLVNLVGMIPRKFTQSAAQMPMDGQAYPYVQNVAIAMRHKEFEKEAEEKHDPAEALE